MRKKHPKLTKEIFERYIEKYLFNPPSKMDEIEVEYYQSQFLGIMKNLTKDFTEEQLVRFYQTPIGFINLIYNTFGLTRKTNFILRKTVEIKKSPFSFLVLKKIQEKNLRS